VLHGIPGSQKLSEFPRSSADPAPLSASDFFTGLGYWTRADVEQWLLATRQQPRRIAKMFANF
jgi:hypothetical protein